MRKMDVLSNLNHLKLPKLDFKDKQILFLLDTNARLSYVQISKHTKLSKDSVRYRISALQKKEVLKGTRAIININKLGYDSYHLFIQFNRPLEEIEEKIIPKLEKHKFIRAILSFSGKYDLELAIVAKSVNKFDLAMEKIILDCGNYLENYIVLITTQSYINRSIPLSFYNKPIKNKSNISNKKSLPENFKLDIKDKQILNEISNNATKLYYQIGNDVGLSADAVTRRIKRMQRLGIIEKFVPVVNYSNLAYGTYALLVQIKNLTSQKKATLKQLLSKDKNVIWATHSIGNYNLLMYLCVKDTNNVHFTLNQIRNYFPEDCNNYEVMIANKEYKYTYLPDF
jgi:DNA-binding Lrp family transcriptional regulator